jgi:hypothetical protein
MLYKILKNNKKIFLTLLSLIIFSPIFFFTTPEISNAAGGFALLENYPGLDSNALNKITTGSSSEALGTYID